MSARLQMLVPVAAYLALSFAVAVWAANRERTGKGARGVLE